MRDFSLTNLMLVTGTSFLVFTAIMWVLDGVIYGFLLKVGVLSMGIGLFLYLVKTLIKIQKRKNFPGNSSNSE